MHQSYGAFNHIDTVSWQEKWMRGIRKPAGMAQRAPMKGFPTIEQVEKADKEQLARRFLPSANRSGPGDYEAGRCAVREIGRHDFGTQQENWDVTDPQSRATFPIPVLHSRCELAFRIRR